LYKFAPPILYAGVPVPGKIVPYIVGMVRNASVNVSVEVSASGGRGLRLSGQPAPDWRLRIALESFVDVLSERLEEELQVDVSYSVAAHDNVLLPSSSIYAILTTAIVEAVAREGGYSLSSSELLEAARSIDEEAGVGLDYIDALRTALVHGKPMVYRRGEDYFELGRASVKLTMMGEVEVESDISKSLDDNTLSLVAKLTSLATIEAAARLRRGEDPLTYFPALSRIENSCFHLLYGVNPPDKKCKWTPSLQQAFNICVEGEGGEGWLEVSL